MHTGRSTWAVGCNPATAATTWLAIVLLLLVQCSLAAKVTPGGLVLEWKKYIHEFKTEPTFNPPKITIQNITDDRSKLAPGYIFVDPRGDELHKSAPLIVDNDGNVVFWGVNFMRKRSGRVQNVHVCDFMGKKGVHICWSEVQSTWGGIASANRMFNASFQQVGKQSDYMMAGNFKNPNPHEFHNVDNGYSFMQVVYHRRKTDLRGYGGPKNGWYMECCFQEVDVKTAKELFRWCAHDHFDLDQTFVYMWIGANKLGKGNGTFPSAGTGTRTDVWDYLHMNAADKNEEGDYLISARHWDAMIKIAGRNAEKVHGVKPGTVLWQLGGKNKTFEMPRDANFGLSHHARFVSTGAETSRVSIFNNLGPSTVGVKISDGRVLEINNVTKKADVVRKHQNPDGGRSAAQGSMNLLPGGNAFIGWGSKPMFSEFAEDGELLLHAHYGKDPGSSEVAYRAYKFPWEAHPWWKPKLLAYSFTCRESPLKAYVSWNGATEVRYWRFFISTSSMQGPWFSVGTYEKEGFETGVTLSAQGSFMSKVTDFVPFVKVEALDALKQPLPNGNASRMTFVPNMNSPGVISCNEDGCPMPHFFDYKIKNSISEMCLRSQRSNYVALALVVALIESINMFWERFCKSLYRPPGGSMFIATSKR